ncbi:cytochrome o ubiquinol oxidase subunit I [Coxiella endosymbiont of Amblyomma sculptum]|uniref:cytochrome o ubiquinol oxidase subunit I n=1 Tax=Coxiella endosymbiont of Amblyomma sculptum TaxID=2487929 RepID=UPI00132E8990|nr:cytochrome o ubiquinol oxidase subunit I [Coxiella endosymbiont of Amblyomma sculptum]QHG92731.1 cytochrome o ubiquinol oxidase subunit I [Coxiella endosymbiont of Amblyomma sculptum]
MRELFLGKLTLSSIPIHTPIIAGAIIFMITVFFGTVVLITVTKKWSYIWNEWIISVDHKKIGIMYALLAGVMLLRGFSDVVLMRSQQAIAAGKNMGFLSPDHYGQIFTAHGVIMIFFVAMPLVFSLANIVLPLQIGARDVAFPYLNSFSFWMTFVGAMLCNVSLVVGDFAATGWLAYPPLSELYYSPTVGVDYFIWSLQISGIGSLLGGINFIATVLKMRAPGMDFMKMPIFVWTTFSSMILVALAFPILTASLALLTLDRLLGMHFFSQYSGGNAMLYINLIWAWGHPEVYILVLPAFGVFSEVVSTFSQKRLFGYATMVYATLIITFLSFVVWAHHFFTMGSGGDVNAVFGIATMIIAVPTGVKIFNWLFTMYRGKIVMCTPILWVFAFFFTFSIGGVAGVLMAVPPIDFQVHNSLFLVAHFHTVIIGGVLFGFFSGFIYWFPKAFGFRLDERLGRWSFIFWVLGFYIAFMPLYLLGLMGVMRRTYHYTDTTLQPYFIVAAVGAALIMVGIFLQITQIVVSIKNRHQLRDNTGDPWNGRTLEWSIASPAPFYNFAFIPQVEEREQFWISKQRAKKENRSWRINPEDIRYTDICMPKNTPVGFFIAIFSGIFGFSIVWHMWIPATTGLIGVVATIVFRTFSKNIYYHVESEIVKKIELRHYRETLC